MTDFREVIGSCIEEIEKFILLFRRYVDETDWHIWDSPQIARAEGEFQLKMQNKISKLEGKLSVHKKKFEAFKNTNNKKAFVEIDNSLKTYSRLVGRIQEHLSQDSNKWTKFVQNFSEDEDIERGQDFYKKLIDRINESHREGEFQIDYMLDIDSAIDSLETYYGIEIDEKETVKLRGGSDANPMTEYYMTTKKFTTK